MDSTIKKSNCKNVERGTVRSRMREWRHGPYGVEPLRPAAYPSTSRDTKKRSIGLQRGFVLEVPHGAFNLFDARAETIIESSKRITQEVRSSYIAYTRGAGTQHLIADKNEKSREIPWYYFSSHLFLAWLVLHAFRYCIWRRVTDYGSHNQAEAARISVYYFRDSNPCGRHLYLHRQSKHNLSG